MSLFNSDKVKEQQKKPQDEIAKMAEEPKNVRSKRVRTRRESGVSQPQSSTYETQNKMETRRKSSIQRQTSSDGKTNNENLIEKTTRTRGQTETRKKTNINESQNNKVTTKTVETASASNSSSAADKKEISSEKDTLGKVETRSKTQINKDTEKEKETDSAAIGNKTGKTETLKENGTRELQSNKEPVKDKKCLSIRLRNISPLTIVSQSDSNDEADNITSDSKETSVSASPHRVTRSVTGTLRNISAKHLLGVEEKPQEISKSLNNFGDKAEKRTIRGRETVAKEVVNKETAKGIETEIKDSAMASEASFGAGSDGDNINTDEPLDAEDNTEEDFSLPQTSKPKRTLNESEKDIDGTGTNPSKRARTAVEPNDADVSHRRITRNTAAQKASLPLLNTFLTGPDKRQFDLTDYLSINAAPQKRKRILELADVVSIDKSKMSEKKKKITEFEENVDGDDPERVKPEFVCRHCNKNKGPTYMRNSKEREFHESCHAVLDDVVQNLLYKCPYCGVLVKGWGGFLNHAVKHEAAMVELDGTSFLENVSFRCKCDECGKQFMNKKLRDKHRSEVHSKQLVSCNICEKKLFANKPKEVLRHLDICRNIIYRCDYCEYLTVVRADMRTHVGFHDKNPVCEICHRGFPNKFLMETHKQNLHNWKGDENIKCPHCDEMFKDRHSLRKHEAIKHADKQGDTFECNICSFVALTEDKLLDHDLVAHQKEYQCPKCSFGTDSEISMEQHMGYHNEDTKYPCVYESCGFRAKDVSSLNEHVATTHVGREFVCPFCSKSFKKKMQLDRHVTTHPTAKTHMCKRCGEKFNLFSDYHRHKEDTGHDSQPGIPTTLPAYKALHSLESEEDQLVRLLVASVHVHKGSGENEPSETSYKIQTAGNNLFVESDKEMLSILSDDTTEMIASIPAVQALNPGDLLAHNENDDTFEAASVLMDLCGKQQIKEPVRYPVIDRPVDKPPPKSETPKIQNKTKKPASRTPTKKLTLVMTDFPPKIAQTEISDPVTHPRFNCPYCKSRVFNDSSDLQFHISSHVESEGVVVSDTYRCQICAKICTKWLRFLHHLAIHRDHHNELIKLGFMQDIIGHFECDICHRVFEHRENLKLHQRYMHKGTKEYTICDICNQTIYSLDIREIDRHLDKCRQVIYRCDFCEYTTLYQNDMKSHSLYHSSGFKCKKCSVVFYSKADLVKHDAALHKTEGPNNKPTCQICGDSFHSKKALHIHLQENHEDEVQWTNVCEICGFKGATLSALQKHTKVMHPKTKIQCYLCKYKTFSEAALIKHMKEHEKKKRELVCGISDCTFTTFIKDHLRAHQKSVHAERNHICPVCGKGFKRKPALHRHIVNHPERKNYTCGECRKVFTKFSTYEMHKTQTGHDAERPVDDAAYMPKDLADAIKKPPTVKRTPAMPKKKDKTTTGDESDQVIIQTNVNGQNVQYILKMEPGTEIQGEDLERSLRAIADLVQSEHKEAELTPTSSEMVPKIEEAVDEHEDGNSITYTAEGFEEVLNAVVTGVSQFESSNIDIVPTVTESENGQTPNTGDSEQQSIIAKPSSDDSIQQQQTILVTEHGQTMITQKSVESVISHRSILKENIVVDSDVQEQRLLESDAIEPQQHFESTLLEAAQTATSVENMPAPNIQAPVSLLSPSRAMGRLEAVPSSSTFQRYIITGNETTSVTAPSSEPAVITKLNSGQSTPVVSVTGDQDTAVQQAEDGTILFTTDTVISEQEEPVSEVTADEIINLDAEALLSGVQGEGEPIELSNGETGVSHIVNLPDGRQVVVVLTPEAS